MSALVKCLIKSSVLATKMLLDTMNIDGHKSIKDVAAQHEKRRI
jgi:hypothetical protein